MIPVIIITITTIQGGLGLRLLESGSLLERDGFLVAQEGRAIIGRCRVQPTPDLGAQWQRDMVDSKDDGFSAGGIVYGKAPAGKIEITRRNSADT